MNSHEDRVLAVKEAMTKLLDDRRVPGDVTLPLELTEANIAGFVWGLQRGDYVVMLVTKFNRATAINLLQFCQWGPAGPPGDAPQEAAPHVRQCVVAYMEKITPQAHADLDGCKLTVIEVFTESDMVNNPTVCDMAPDYEVLTGAAAEAAVPLGEREGVARMRFTDPARRYYGAKPGDVFRFHRHRPPAPPAVQYRVVEPPA